MIEQARSKAADRGLVNADFGYGEFRDPHYEGEVDIGVPNFALHHLSDEEKREAIEAIADLGARRFVLGDATFFGSPDPEDPLFDHGVDGATVGMLVDTLTDAGFVVTAVERVHDQVGVLVAERSDEEPEYDSREPITPLCRMFALRSAVSCPVQESLLDADQSLQRLSEVNPRGWVLGYAQGVPHIVTGRRSEGDDGVILCVQQPVSHDLQVDLPRTAEQRARTGQEDTVSIVQTELASTNLASALFIDGDHHLTERLEIVKATTGKSGLPNGDRGGHES